VTVSRDYVRDFGKDLQGIKVHLKLNTGMNRIGIRPEEARETLDLLLSCGAYVKGVMTHYVSSDDDETYTEHQYELFRSCVETLDYPFECIHLQNSDGSVHFPNDLTTHIRPGIALLGYSSYESELKPCVGLYAEVVESKIIHAGETVSYGRHYTAKQDARILTLPIGYADGFYRSNTGREVYVNGEYGIIRGSVCMDQMMVETKKDVPLGTPVELYGPHVDLTKRAKELGTINYELLTSLSDRLTRVYVEDGNIRKIDRPRFNGTGR
ncbi:MAG: alanine racemase, partial [Erysipelotrichaceae bacterium]|nr:alanine racemase [Erysipelotrichaceae bacterium]